MPAERGRPGRMKHKGLGRSAGRNRAKLMMGAVGKNSTFEALIQADGGHYLEELREEGEGYRGSDDKDSRRLAAQEAQRRAPVKSKGQSDNEAKVCVDAGTREALRLERPYG